jgi:hypothetical protein
MAAFDRLPRPLRLLIAFGPYPARPIDAENALRAGRTVGQVSEIIRMTWRGTPSMHARAWRKKYASEYPHAGARATVLWTQPFEAMTARERLQARRLARLRVQAPEREVRKPVPNVIYL